MGFLWISEVNGPRSEKIIKGIWHYMPFSSRISYLLSPRSGQIFSYISDVVTFSLISVFQNRQMIDFQKRNDNLKNQQNQQRATRFP